MAQVWNPIIGAYMDVEDAPSEANADLTSWFGYLNNPAWADYSDANLDFETIERLRSDGVPDDRLPKTMSTDPYTATVLANRAINQGNNAKNQQELDALKEKNSSYEQDQQWIRMQQDQLLRQQYGYDQDFVGQTQGLTDQFSWSRDAANGRQQVATDQYTAGLTGLNDFNMRQVQDLGGLYDDLAATIQSQVHWAGDLTSQGAQAYADPGAIAAQNEAMGFLSGAMNGSLDYESVAAEAYADPRYTAALEQGLSDLYGVAGGSKDVRPGELDPAAYKNSVEAMEKYKLLSDPKITAQEQFMFEQARLKQEQDERASRGAIMNNLRARGMGGSGMELTNAALANQQTSQNRLLSDLGALANADARSIAALGGWSESSQALNAQANALATGNKNRQANALGMYVDGMGNLRQASFDEAYKRGLAADDASAHNQATRLQGGISYGNLASTQRAQSFDEAYKRGVSADNMAQFNRASSIDVDKFNTNFAASERDAQWNRGMGKAQVGLTASGMNAQNLGSIHTAQTDTIRDQYGRNKDVIAAQDMTNSRLNTSRSKLTSGQSDILDKTGADRERALGREGQLASTQIGLNNQAAGSTIGLNNQSLGFSAGQLAINDAQRRAGGGSSGGTQADPDDPIAAIFGNGYIDFLNGEGKYA